MFKSLSGISSLLAQYGPGKMPANVLHTVERHYHLYRVSYNSTLVVLTLEFCKSIPEVL